MLINKNFTKLWIGQTISVVGDEVFDTTLLIWVGFVLLNGKPYAPAVSSMVLIITSVVIIGLGPIAGVFVDRWDKRRTMLRADLIRAALVALLLVISIFPSLVSLPVKLVVIGLVVALATAAAQFFNPARIVLIKDIVPDEAQGRASSYSQSAFALATIIGPPLAAPLLVSVGVPWAIVVNAASFLLSFLLIRMVRVNQPAVPPVIESDKASVRGELVAGLKFMRGHRLVMAVLVTAIVVNLGVGAFNALDLYFVAENLHAAPKWFGILGGAFGVGAVLGAVFGGVLGDRVGHVKVVVSGLVAAGILMVVYSRLGSVWAAIPVIILIGLSVGGLNSALFPVVMKSVPREFLGRVMAVIGPANRLGGILSIAVASVLVSTILKELDTRVAGVHLGRIDSVFLVAGVIVALSGVYFGWSAKTPAGGQR